MKKSMWLCLGAVVGLYHANAIAAETTIGSAIEKKGMEIGAVYLQPVAMEMHGKISDTADADVHLEADIHAVQNNPNGFAYGEWIPYLTVNYDLTKAKSSWHQTGTLVPMIASDGPHYGKNIKLDGPGKYHVVYHIDPPSVNGFHRHVDKETGVGKWWEPFDVQWDFVYLGTGKKGGY